jgi:hypothetical protein
MLGAGVLLFIALLQGLSTWRSMITGKGDEGTPDRDNDRVGHASGNRFGLQLTLALVVGGLICLILGV